MRKRGRFEAPPTPRPSWKQTNTHLQMMVTSAVSMLLCCSMLLGTTMAWFTDSVVSSGNQITIGTLEVDITYQNRSLNPDKKESPEEVFDSSIAWSPNRFEARTLTVKNSGNLDVKYILNLQCTDLAVAKYFEVFINTNTDITTGTLAAEERDGWVRVGNLADLFISGGAVYTGSLVAAQSASMPTVQTIGVALHMPEDITASAESESIFGQNFTLYVKLNAYQTDLSSEAMSAMNAENTIPLPEDNSDSTGEDPADEDTDGEEITDGDTNGEEITGGDATGEDITDEDTDGEDITGEDTDGEEITGEDTDGEDI